MDKWGPDIWKYIHTYTVLVNDQEFRKHKKEILHHLVTVATNLPCPICTEHAKKYLANNKLRVVTDKQSLIKLFFEFHNNVNTQKKKQLQTIDILHSYTNNNIHECAIKYLDTWLKSSSNRYLGYSNSFTRKLYMKQFKEFYIKYNFVFKH